MVDLESVTSCKLVAKCKLEAKLSRIVPVWEISLVFKQ